jgi:hypothetical protein
VRNAGWTLLTIAFAIALLTNVSGRENVWLLSTLLITFVLAVALLSLDFTARIYRGDLKLRPWDAAKKAAAIFVIVLALTLLTLAVFQSRDFELSAVIIQSAVLALAYGLYTTAYRKPA